MNICYHSGFMKVGIYRCTDENKNKFPFAEPADYFLLENEQETEKIFF